VFHRFVEDLRFVLEETKQTRAVARVTLANTGK